MAVWKAEKYRNLRAVPDGKWTQLDPFGSYRPHAPQRQVEACPHAIFLRLRKLFLDKYPRYLNAMDVFASNFGLLGLFHHRYSAPILPNEKVYISPEAVIKNNRLEFVDPATEGLELVAKAVIDSRAPTHPRFERADYGIIAMPDEVRFAVKDPYRYPDDPSGRLLYSATHESWEEVRMGYDALFVFVRSAERSHRYL
jgi:hypothetical protein